MCLYCLLSYDKFLLAILDVDAAGQVSISRFPSAKVISVIRLTNPMKPGLNACGVFLRIDALQPEMVDLEATVVVAGDA